MPIRPLPPCAAPGCTALSRNYSYKGGPALCSSHIKRMRKYGQLDPQEDPYKPRIKRQPVPPTMADRGCEYSPSCLRCHLSKCVEDMTPPERARLAAEHMQRRLMARTEERPTF